MSKPKDVSARAWKFALDHESDTDGRCGIPTETLARAFDKATADLRGAVRHSFDGVRYYDEERSCLSEYTPPNCERERNEQDRD